MKYQAIMMDTEMRDRVAPAIQNWHTMQRQFFFMLQAPSGARAFCRHRVQGDDSDPLVCSSVLQAKLRLGSTWGQKPPFFRSVVGIVLHGHRHSLGRSVSLCSPSL